MNENPVRHALTAGQIPLGTLVMEFDTTAVARIAASCGADFVMFDMEHTGWSMERIRTLVATTRGTSVAPFVRIPSIDANFVGRALDVGALGIMVPAIETPEQARAFTRAARFPPAGERRFGLIYSDQQQATLGETCAHFNEQVLLIGQIETTAGLENVDSIAATPGLDVLWLGPYDLTISLGFPNELEHPRYREGVRRMLEACTANGKVPGILIENRAEAEAALEAGFRLLMVGFDASLYEQALRAGIAETRDLASRVASQVVSRFT